MNATDLDTVYTSLANAIQAVGKDHETLFLSTLALSLLAKQGDINAALSDIAQAQRLAII